MRVLLLILSFSLFSATHLYANGVTGADVLKARLSARAVALGDTYAGLGDDVSAQFYNPAGWAGLSSPRLAFAHWTAIAQVNYEYFSYAHPTEFGVFGAGLISRGQPDINNPLASDSPVSASDLVLAATYAQRLGALLPNVNDRIAQIRGGVSLKYVRSHLGRYDADAYAADLGMRMPVGDGIQLGAALLNVGTPMKFIEVSDPLPSTLLVGVSRGFDLTEKNHLNIAADVEYPAIGTVRFHGGLEDWLNKSFAMRLGYLVDNEQSLNGLTGGFGLAIGQEGLVIDFDYAFRPVYYDGFSSFQVQHLFGVSLSF